MKRFAVAACCAFLLISMEASAQQRQKCTGAQIGTWKLQSFTTEDLASGQKTDLFGVQPSGYISYGSDCRMYAIVIKDGRKRPAALVPTDAERAELFSGLIAYAGTYTIAGDKVSHHIDASWNQAWTGTTQVRLFRIDGNTLYIKTVPNKSSLTGTEVSSALVWIKVE